MILGSLGAVNCAALEYRGIQQLGVSLNELLPTLERKEKPFGLQSCLRRATQLG